MDEIELMADDHKLIRELGESEKWLGTVCPNDDINLQLDQDRLKRHVRLAVQEAWLARQLQTVDRTPESLTASISGRIKQQLTDAGVPHTTKRYGKSRGVLKPWHLRALATAAVIGIVAAGINLYHPTPPTDSFTLLDSLLEDSPLSNDLDMSLTVLAKELDDLSWTLQSLDDSIDGDIQYTYDQFEAADIGDTLAGSLIES